jgi:hypothetical protein
MESDDTGSSKKYTKIATKEEDPMMFGAIGVGQGASVSRQPNGNTPHKEMAPIVVVAEQSGDSSADSFTGDAAEPSIADDILGDDVV